MKYYECDMCGETCKSTPYFLDKKMAQRAVKWND